MAWISGLADKAENILNKIDQNAATALSIPADGATIPVVSAMRKNLSTSTQSLKASLSPSRSRSRLGTSQIKSSGGSVKSESSLPKEKVEWTVGGDNATSSRRSSVSSKADSIAIEMGGIGESDQETVISNSASLMANKSISGSLDSQELTAFKIALQEISNERDELRMQLSDLNHDVENAGLKQRSAELETLLQSIMAERDQAQQALVESQNASSAYIHSISELETNLAKLQQDYLEVAQKLQIQIKETEQQRQELKDYRLKAQRALQMKDNIINEMKSNGNERSGAGTTGSDADHHLLNSELAALSHENHNVKEENQKLNLQLEDLRKECAELERLHNEQLDAFRANEEALRKELRSEREHHIATESQQRVLQQELTTLRQQLSNHLAASATKLQEKEQQLQQLRVEALSKRPISDESLGDYDTRLKTLTQTLVDKQNNVERITAERNALRIQLEKMHDKLQQAVYANNQARNSPSRNSLLSNSTDDTKAQYPSLMRENPFDNRVARRMKRAYTSLDSAGIRLGAFLRRYPLMRICVLMYVALLHIWVMFILLSYTPN